MSDEVVLGEMFAAAVPGRAASVAEAIEWVAGRPAVIEVLVDGPATQAHRSDGEVRLLGEIDDADAVAAAVRSVEATSAVLDVVVTDEGVRFTDLLLLDGEPLTRRPLAERLTTLAEVAPAWFMVDRTSLDLPAWGEAFAEHARARGVRGVCVRLLAAPRVGGDSSAWERLVLWD